MKNNVKQLSLKRSLPFLMLFGAIAFFVTGCGNSPARSVNGKKVVDAQMQYVADELNKTCPMMVDSETQLDSVTVPQKNNLKYHYTLINTNIGDVVKEDFDAIMIPMVQNSYNTHPDLEDFRVKKTILSYSYFCTNGDHLTEFSVEYDGKK